MQEQEIELIICKTLTALGWDVRNPQAAQADLIYLRNLRTGSELMTTRMKIGFISILLSTAAFIAWAGVKSIFRV